MTYQRFDAHDFLERLPAEASGDLSGRAEVSGFSNFSKTVAPSGAPDSVRDALAALRPHLTNSLAALPDEKLLALVGHAVANARERAMGHYRRYCPVCGLPLSVVAVGEKCGYCARQE